MPIPLVSVICISHNHEPFIHEAIKSVLHQSYENIEIIAVDDGSNDNSQRIIKDLDQKYSQIQSILLDTNIGNCKAFNIGLSRAKGDFVIDLAADDVLLPERIKEGLVEFNRKGHEYGVNFSDAAYINSSGHLIGYHYKRDKNNRLIKKVPEGNIYKDLLARYFICTPTMMTRKSIYDQLGGYDENLYYEDFDFWIRSGKITKYCYTDKVLVNKRILKNSLSSRQYIKNSKILQSTYKVCLKAEQLNETDEDRKALTQRVFFEFRKALFSGNRQIAYNLSCILKRNIDPGIKKSFITAINTILKIVGRYEC
jgi:glycosyltransferase involved in cell wall biosynthesis